MLDALKNRLRKGKPDENIDRLQGDVAQSRERMKSVALTPAENAKEQTAPAKAAASSSAKASKAGPKRPDNWSRAPEAFPDPRRGQPGHRNEG